MFLSLLADLHILFYMLDRTVNDIFDIIGDCDICINLKAPLIAFVLPDELVCTVICPVPFILLILHVCAPESVTIH